MQLLPPDVSKIALVLAIAFFIGLDREEHKQHDKQYAFGGVRTFPFIGLVSYALALMASPGLVPWVVGFAVVGGFMLVSYHYKLAHDPPAGLTTEVSALATYVVGGLAEREHFWIATTIGVVSVLLLELKKGLEGLTKRVAPTEIIAVAKFLVLAAVILPIIPDEDLTPLHLNPFKTWVVVVAVSGVSFASYVLQRVLKQRAGVTLSALLGGAYSSTVTTVALARRAKNDARPNLFAGSILVASAVMYLRLVLLLAFFDASIARTLAPEFVGLAIVGAVVGWLVSRRDPGAGVRHKEDARDAVNPLELKAAFVFALIFVVVVVLTHLAQTYLGRGGLYSLAAIMGVTDVDPFILGLAQRGTTPTHVAAVAIVIAAASNNAIKAIYAYAFADKATGRMSFGLLIGFAALGLSPLAWM